MCTLKNWFHFFSFFSLSQALRSLFREITPQPPEWRRKTWPFFLLSKNDNRGCVKLLFSFSLRRSTSRVRRYEMFRTIAVYLPMPSSKNILHSFLFSLLMHEEGCMEPLLRLSTCHSTSNGNPLTPHSNDTFCPLSLENSISTLGLTNQGFTRQLTKEYQYVRWYFSNKPSRYS